MQQQPKAFVGHSDADKERFVVDFAKKLRQRGIYAWFDQWEIQPGDSLVDKVFSEGIGKADAVIVVLSENSVDRPWVKAELNASVIRRIEEKTRLIPVILDNLEKTRIPESLRDVHWIRIPDLENYEEELSSIVNAIHGVYEKPPLGTPPAYTQAAIKPIADLPRAASIALKLCYEMLMECYARHGESEGIIAQMEALGFSHKEALEALTILHDRHYIKGAWPMGVEILPWFNYTTLGLHLYINAYVPDYPKLERDVVAELVNQQRECSHEIADVLEQPYLLVDHIFERLGTRGLIRNHPLYGDGGNLCVWQLSPELKYRLQDLDAKP